VHPTGPAFRVSTSIALRPTANAFHRLKSLIVLLLLKVLKLAAARITCQLMTDPDSPTFFLNRMVLQFRGVFRIAMRHYSNAHTDSSSSTLRGVCQSQHLHELRAGTTLTTPPFTRPTAR
jgi:hypothetical protein